MIDVRRGYLNSLQRRAEPTGALEYVHKYRQMRKRESMVKNGADGDGGTQAACGEAAFGESSLAQVALSGKQALTGEQALTSEQGGILAAPLERFLGKRTAHALAKLAIHTVSDLLEHVPFRLAQRGELMPIEAVHEGEAVTVVARVLSSAVRPMHARRGFILGVTVTDGQHDLELTFFAKNSRPLKFHEQQLAVGTVAVFSGTVSSYRDRKSVV